MGMGWGLLEGHLWTSSSPQVGFLKSKKKAVGMGIGLAMVHMRRPPLRLAPRCAQLSSRPRAAAQEKNASKTLTAMRDARLSSRAWE
eukprot:7266077-Pyramimonas_sp.AAC.1